MKNNSEPKLNLSNNAKSNVAQSAMEIGRKSGNDPSSLITQVPQQEKVDIESLTNTEEIEDFYDYTENCLLLINKMKMPDISEIEHLRIDLPKSLKGKKLAIFDLDETLIHCVKSDESKADKYVTITFNGVKKRVSFVYNKGFNILNFILIYIKFSLLDGY